MMTIKIRNLVLLALASVALAACDAADQPVDEPPPKAVGATAIEMCGLPPEDVEAHTFAPAYSQQSDGQVTVTFTIFAYVEHVKWMEHVNNWIYCVTHLD